MADCDWLSLEGRIITLLDRRVESVHVDVNDLANPRFVHRWRLTCVSRHPRSNCSRPATMIRNSVPRGRKAMPKKKTSSSQSLDEGRHPTTQSLFEGENARGGSRESDEANRGCGPAKGEDDRNWSRSSPLRIATHRSTSPKSGGPLDAPVYPGGLRFARPAIKAVEDAVLTLATRLEQIENMVHPTQEVNSPRVAAVRPRVSARPGPADRGPAPARLDGVSLRSPSGGLSASWRSAAAWRIA